MIYQKLAKRFPSVKNYSVNLVAIILTAIGLSTQLSYIVYDYTRYSITYDERFEFPFELLIPDIMVCSSFMFVLKYDLLLTEHRELFGDICHDEKSCHQNRVIHEKVRDRFSKGINMDQAGRYLIGSKEILEMIQVGPDQTNQLGNNCLALDHIMYPESCFTLTCRESGIPIKIHRGINGVSFFHEILRLTFNVSILKRDFQFRLVVQPPENPYTTPNDLGSSVKGNRRGLARFQFRYNRVFIQRLPAPYETNCKHFVAEEELDECLNRYHLTKFGAPCPGRFIHPSRYLGKGYKMVPVRLGDRNELFATCFRQLQKECSTVRYTSSVQSEEFIDDDSERVLRVDILGPVEHDVVMFAYPKVSLSSLVILISNIVTAWFGISVFNTIVALILFAKKLRRSRTRVQSDVKCEKRGRFYYGVKYNPRLFTIRGDKQHYLNYF